jgi:hypothetical protein
VGGLGHFRQGRAVFGVDGAAVALQQAGTAEEPCAVPQPREAHVLLGGAAQQLDQVVVGLELGAKTAADHQQIQAVQRRGIETRIRADHQAQVADHFPVVTTEGTRGEQIRPQQVGGDHGVERLGECWQGEMFEQQEADASDRRRLGGFVEVAQVLAFHATAELASFHRGLAHFYC